MNNKEPLTVLELPVLGGLKVLDIRTKKVLHEKEPDEPGDMPPDVAIRNIVAVYAADDTLIIEVD